MRAVREDGAVRARGTIKCKLNRLELLHFKDRVYLTSFKRRDVERRSTPSKYQEL